MESLKMTNPFNLPHIASMLAAPNEPEEPVYPPGGEGTVTAAVDGAWTGWSADGTVGSTFGSFGGDEPLGGATMLAVVNYQVTQLYFYWADDVRDRLTGKTITLGGEAFAVADAASVTYYAGSPGSTEVAYNSPALLMEAAETYQITVGEA
jgi:hypothetical protein